MRITKKHLAAKVNIVNGMLGSVESDWNTVGAVRLYHDLTGYNVHRVSNTSGGVESLSTIGTASETSAFLQGMIAALRIAREEVWTPPTVDERRAQLRRQGRRTR